MAAFFYVAGCIRRPFPAFSGLCRLPCCRLPLLAAIADR
jgi:hypothetical protein